MTTYRTKLGNYLAQVDSAGPWDRADFAWLGTIDLGDGLVIGWAWHLDGRSVDRCDSGFDLVGFPKPDAIVRLMLDSHYLASRPRPPSCNDG